MNMKEKISIHKAINSIVSDAEIFDVIGSDETPEMFSLEEITGPKGSALDHIADILYPDPLTTVMALEASLGYPLAVGADDGSLVEHRERQAAWRRASGASSIL